MLEADVTLDWSKLEPHRPVEPGDPLYVERPTSASAGVVARLQRGARVVLVSGPAGIGKSTELGHVASEMSAQFWPCLVQFDRTSNMRTFTADQATMALWRRLSVEANERWGLKPKSGSGPQYVQEAFLSLIREITSATGRDVLFLVDGLEKSPVDVARPIFDMLGELAKEARLVVIMPWFATYGPMSQTVIHETEKVAHLRPVTVGRTGAEAGRKFLWLMLRHRLGLTAVPHGQAVKIVDVAAKLSGGVPRTFLQLLADAASRAQFSRDADWPDAGDLREAAEDMTDSFRRLLQQGDIDALLAAENTSGTEMELLRKLRLLNHGILLEYAEGREIKMHMHPLVLPLVKKG